MTPRELVGRTPNQPREKSITTYLPSGVKDIEETRLRVDDGALLVGVLDRRVVVVDEVVLHVLQCEG